MDTDKDFQRADKYGWKLIVLGLLFVGFSLGFVIRAWTSPKVIGKTVINQATCEVLPTATTTILEEKQRCEEKDGRLSYFYSALTNGGDGNYHLSCDNKVKNIFDIPVK